MAHYEQRNKKTVICIKYFAYIQKTSSWKCFLVYEIRTYEAAVITNCSLGTVVLLISVSVTALMIDYKICFN
jgi:hypothetical protein